MFIVIFFVRNDLISVGSNFVEEFPTCNGLDDVELVVHFDDAVGVLLVVRAVTQAPKVSAGPDVQSFIWHNFTY